jgi:hypothetical protein
LIVLVVLFSILLTLFAIWTRRVFVDRMRLETQQKRLQAIQLSEAGIERAVARHAVDATYTQENWSVPAAELGGKRDAIVRIKITPNTEQSAMHYEAVSEYPVGDVRCVRVTRSKEIAN